MLRERVGVLGQAAWGRARVHVARRLSARRGAGVRPLGAERHTPVVGGLLKFLAWFQETVLDPELEDDDARFMFYDWTR